MIGFAGDDEHRAVLEHAGAGGQRETAGGEQVAIDGERGHAPGVRAQHAGAAADERFQPAVLLLEVLGSEEHALLPDHAVGPAHDVSYGFLI